MHNFYTEKQEGEHHAIVECSQSIIRRTIMVKVQTLPADSRKWWQRFKDELLNKLGTLRVV